MTINCAVKIRGCLLESALFHQHAAHEQTGETIGGVTLQQFRQSPFGVSSLSSRELRLRECPQIVAIAVLNRNRVFDPFDRHRALAALHQDPPLLEQTCRLNQALRPLRFREKHIGPKECRNCEEDQPESSQERSSRDGFCHYSLCSVRLPRFATP